MWAIYILIWVKYQNYYTLWEFFSRIIFLWRWIRLRLIGSECRYIRLQIEYSTKRKKTKMEKENHCREKMKKDAFALCKRFLNWNSFDHFKGESLLIIRFNCPGVARPRWLPDEAFRHKSVIKRPRSSWVHLKSMNACSQWHSLWVEGRLNKNLSQKYFLISKKMTFGITYKNLRVIT